MPTNPTSNYLSLTSQGVILLSSVGVLAFMGLYLIFTLIVMRQVFLMTAVIMTGGGWLVRLIAVLYSILVLGVIMIVVLGLLM